MRCKCRSQERVEAGAGRATHGALARPLRVILVNDSAQLRRSIAHAFAELQSVSLVGCFADPGEALKAVKGGLEFEVGLVEFASTVASRGMSSEDLIRELGRRRPGVPLVVFASRVDDEALFGALRAGAAGYLIDDISIDGLHGAVRLAAEGGSPLSPSLGRRVLNAFCAERLPRRTLKLSKREAEVLEALASGWSYRQIAKSFGIAQGTVQTHVKKIYEKLGVHSKVAAVRVAFELRARQNPEVTTEASVESSTAR